MAERKSTGSNTQIHKKIDALDEKMSVIVEALVGKVGENAPGLLERVRKLEDWVNSEKKLIYTIVLIIIADIVTRLWSLIVQ